MNLALSVPRLVVFFLTLTIGFIAPIARAASCAPAPGGLVAWWQFSNSGQDSVGTATMTLNNGATYGTGEVGQGLSLDGINDFGQVSATSSLNLGISSGMSIEAWIKTSDASKIADIVEWNNGSIGLHLATASGAARDFYANLVDTSGTSHPVSSGANTLSDNVFQHVALTYDKTSGMAALYINGVRRAFVNVGSFTPQTTYPFYVGTRPAGPFAGSYFPGIIDELSLYNRALSTNEVQAIFSAGAAGKCAGPTPLAIITPPQNATVQESNAVSFSVVAQGTPPLQYQWLFDGAVLTNRTQSPLNLTNVQSAQAGGYSVIVSDTSGSVTSTVATLTVTPAPTCGSLSSGLTAWWRFNNDGQDNVGTAALTLNNGATFGTGEVGPGLFLDGVDDFASANAAASLNIGASSGMTIEMWIKPANAAKSVADILEWNNTASSSIGVHLAISTSATRDLYANLVDTTGTSHSISSGANALADNVFQHIALTYDKTSGQAALYVNGVRVALANLGIFTPQTSYPLYLGVRPSGPFAEIYFPGVIDEPSLYNRVLSQAEVQAIFASGAAGKCSEPRPLAIITNPQGATVQESNSVTFTVVAQGTPPLQYIWLYNSEPILGQTQTVCALTNLQLADAGDYSVLVYDATGRIASAIAVLTVIQPLGIISQPQNVIGVTGGSASFSVVAKGNPPRRYQWFFNGSALSGETQTTLTLQNIAPNRSGRYFVTVTNNFGAVTSAPAALTILSASSPVITEFMAENDGPVIDEDGETSDWIEIFNPGPGAVNLLNWCLTDDPVNLIKWRFPETSLAANSYLLVFASSKERATPGAPLHTNFKLDAAGGYLALVQPDGITIANEFFAYSSQRSSVSFGLAGGVVYFPTPTPGAANNFGVLGFVNDTKFSTNRGFFFAPFDLTITCATPGATIFYTTNGDEPALGSGFQAAPLNSTSPPQAVIHVTATTTLRAAAFKDGFVPSDIDTHSYIFPASVASQTRPPGASSVWIEDPPGDGNSYPADFAVDASVVNNALPGYSFSNALMSLPAISLVTSMDGFFGPVNGIYTHPLKEGTNWERATSVELIYPNGSTGFHAGAGVQLHGDVSQLPHATPKHPLRLLFREKYGITKLDFPLFPGPVKKFDQLVLRACSTDAWPIANTVDFLWRNYDATYQRDQWMRDSQLAFGELSANGIYVQLFINGVYWGMYNLTERINDSFAADHLGGQKEEYDVIQGEFTETGMHVASAGTDTTWNQMLQMANLVPGNPAKYWELQGRNPDGTRSPNFPVLLDLDNLIDYMLLHIYAPAVDWPNRNWWSLRRRDTGPAQLDSTGFKFLVWDQEVAADRLDRTITWANNSAFEQVSQADTPAQVYDRLRNNPEFKLRFADHLQKHLFNGGALTLGAIRARWANRSAEIDHAIVGESARWGDAQQSPAYKRETDWLVKSNFMQNTYWPSNEVKAWQRFRNVGLYPTLGAPNFNQFGGSVTQGFILVLTHTNAVGTIYYTLDGSDPRVTGGALSASAQIYSSGVALASPTFVRARMNDGTMWSAIVEAEFFPPQDLSKLQLSELMYNPPKVGLIDGDEFEFLELKNIGAVTLDLSGLTFTHGINFTFTNETLLGAGQYFVLARNAAQFAAKYPGAPLDGLYTGKLDNNGENVALATALGATIFAVTYNNAAPWPVEADNSGLSLQRMNFTLNVTNPVSWIAATPTPGGSLPADLIDSDGDGMPDGWEIAHGLNPNLDDAADDPDGDGLTNYQEFIAGTDPRDGADRLELESLFTASTSSNVTIVLGFPARSNKTYTVVYRNTAAVGAWTNLLRVNSVSTNRFITVTNTVGVATGTRFYRLATPRLP